ncbi:6-phosphogluconolactonase [Micrococcoides hystricis]|uniref:6-phosphogluconolactonase n=1 Tax=Micrococcoides hystricis TaxID=1572761 RepID=A0ABV6P7Z5_9MICC
MLQNVDLRLFPDADRLAAEMVAALIGVLARRQQSGGTASIVCTGGSMGKAFAARLMELHDRNDETFFTVDWAAVHYWFGDERYVPVGDPERNDGLLAEFFATAKVPAENIHRVLGPEDSDDVTDSAYAYAEQLRAAYPELTERFASERDERTPIFDVVMLGVGPDGHVASLFPGHPAAQSTGVTVGLSDSPKPPPERVSLTTEMINSAARVWILATGAEKAPVLAEAFTSEASELPVSKVYGAEQTMWWLDHAAAEKLPRGEH